MHGEIPDGWQLASPAKYRLRVKLAVSRRGTRARREIKLFAFNNVVLAGPYIIITSIPRARLAQANLVSCVGKANIMQIKKSKAIIAISLRCLLAPMAASSREAGVLTRSCALATY